MNFQTRPRYVVASIFGALSVVLLSLLLTRGKTISSPSEPDEPSVIISSGTVRPGETMAYILVKNGVQPPFITGIQRALNSSFNLRRMQPNHTYEIIASTDGIIQKFIYRLNPINSIIVHRSADNIFESTKVDQQTEWRTRKVVGEVTDNMYKDLLKQGHSETFVANLVGDLADNIFGWKIDFFTEQRPGDRFEILMEQEYIVGENEPLWNGRGRILAASYIGKATRVRENYAFRYQEPGSKHADYYDKEGNAVRRAFLRAPFTHGAFRISSGYNKKRFHPILRIYRPHHGTDYAAATGTPVSSIGKGTVIRAGWYKGYGNCIEVRHNGKYVSRYGHLSKIAVKHGQSVAQGQYIGRVGSTGLSTGPHLHFEMLVDGTQRNFLTMNFPAASAVAKKNMADFEIARDGLMGRLNTAVAEAPNQLSMNIKNN